jgi:hypothetical protein
MEWKVEEPRKIDGEKAEGTTRKRNKASKKAMMRRNEDFNKVRRIEWKNVKMK